MSHLDLKILPSGSSLRADQLAVITVKSDEILALTEKTREITARMSALASESSANASEQNQDTLREILQELKQVNGRLEKLEREVTDLKGWVEGQKETLPALTKSVKALSNNKNTNYVQFQFRDTGARSGGFAAGRGKQHTFAMRRVRVGLQQSLDPKMSIRTSFDLATGPDSTSLQMRDAFLQYDIQTMGSGDGLQLKAGQQNVPMGTEISRSSSAREFPERATYNRILFDGERNRGLVLSKELGKSWTGHLGLGTSLTYNDPEQRSRSNTSKLAGYGGLRTIGKNFEFGASYFQGEREGFTLASVNHPEITRQFFYLDGVARDVFGSGIDVRGELMVGKDRRPINRTSTTGPASPQLASDVSGYQVQLGYRLNERNELFGRYAVSDFDTDSVNNAVREYGLSYRYALTSAATLSLSYEIFEDNAFASAGKNGEKFNVLTLRYQFRF